MSLEFGTITTANRYVDNPVTNRIVQQFDYEYGNRTGINFFMPEEAQHAAALERGDGEKLFTTG